MSYNPNPNPGVRNLHGPGRKVLRVSDVNAMGPPAATMPSNAPYMSDAAFGQTAMDPMYSNANMGTYAANPPTTSIGGFNSEQPTPQIPQNQNYGYSSVPPISQPQAFQTTSPMPQAPYVGVPGTGPGLRPAQSGIAGDLANTMPQFSMFQQPMVQDMAMQYGQHLADQGKQLVENQFEKYIPVARLKYYFAVDNNYVINKMRLLFFPFTHKDWSLKYDQENPVQPRYDINAPDLYIPTMAYITYVVVAGLMMGMQNRFTPEKLGMTASSALAYSIFELVVYSITLYVVNIKTNLKTLDLLAFAGYKFVVIVACLLMSTIFHAMGYYAMLIYSSLTLGFFLLRTLKTKVLHDTTPAAASGVINYDPYGTPQQLDYSGGRKRKLYFLFLIVGGQALLSFLLSKHLYLTDTIKLDA